MPFSSLHTVELQLIMHHCTLADLLRFARCNRVLRQAASAQFAFLHSPAFELCSLQPNLLSTLKAAPIRFNPRLGLRMMPAAKGTAKADFTAALALLKCAPPLHSFDCLSLPQLHLDPLLTTPALRSLRVLRLRHDVPFDGSAIRGLIHLRDLTFHCSPHWRMLESLPALPSLFSLTLSFFSLPPSFSELPDEAFAAVGQCVSLRSLSVCNLFPSQLPLILSPRMHALTSLTVLDLRLTRRDNVSLYETAEWCACLSLPPQLRRIEFVRFATLRKMLFQLTSTLDSQGPLREILFHPRPGAISGAGPDFMRVFLNRFSLLTSVELETPRIAPHRATLSQASYPSFTLRAREANVNRYASLALAETTLDAFRDQMHELLMGDPRVSVVECAALVPREDEDRALVEKYPPTKRGCCIS